MRASGVLLFNHQVLCLVQPSEGALLSILGPTLPAIVTVGALHLFESQNYLLILKHLSLQVSF